MQVANIETFYQLSQLQQGMLFHNLFAPDSGVDIEQVVCELRETLHLPAFEQAWQTVIDRQPVLRTSFRWRDLDSPIQQVWPQLTCPLQQQDWRSLPQTEQATQLAAFLQTDRRQGFDLAEPPLLRLALFHRAEADCCFVWTFHHAILDGQSLRIILVELFACYDALVQGQTPRLPAPPRPFRDYIEGLPQDLTGAQNFWQQQLKGLAGPPPLVVDKMSTKAGGSESGYTVRQIQLTVALTVSLKALAQKHKLTLDVLVQGAWALLLHRYSGHQDIVFGLTRSVRRSALNAVGTESMVGLLINTLPVRLQLSPDLPVLTWLQALHVQDQAMQAYEHTPLVKIQEWSEIPSGLPLFENILVFEDRSLNAALQAQGGPWKQRSFRLYEQTNYPLTLTIYPDEHLSLQLAYDHDRFDDTTMSRLLGHLQTLLEGFYADIEQPIAKIPLLTGDEKQQMLVVWNATQADYPRDKCLHQLFEAQAQKTPDAAAITLPWVSSPGSSQPGSGEPGQLTYGELNRQANQLAHHLQSLGVGPDVTVGISVERSLEMMIGLLGILKAGGAYVPLDPTYPPERLAFMLADAGVGVILTQARLMAMLPESDVPVLCLDTGWETIGRESEENPASQVTPENLAYVIYTSGSTGRPKGVQVNHQSVVNLIETTRPVFHFDERDVWTLVHSFGFDFSVWEIWTPLLSGSRLVIVPLWVTQSPEDFYNLLCTEHVTVLNQTPSAIRQLIQAGQIPPTDRGWSLRLLVCGGEALPQELAAQLLAWHIPAWNFYGPTEATVWATITEIEPTQTKGGAAPIGRPLPNVQIFILNSELEPVPAGVPGDLYIGGHGLARGYHHRPALTAEKFRPHPFSSEPGARLYKTGDLARYLPDGQIEFLGRIDHQVKIRGFRIELGEIEATLIEHPAVQEAVVMAREDAPGQPRLVAYIIPRQDRAPTKKAMPTSSTNGEAGPGQLTGELRRYLQTTLPDYMIPAAFILMDTLPLTPNRKVDRRALPAPDTSRPDLAASYVPPGTRVEQTIAGLWSELLGLEKVGRHDNFFELGGHSLLATQLVSRLRAACQVDLPIPMLFESPTVARLAERIETIRWAAQGQPMAASRDDRDEGEL